MKSREVVLLELTPEEAEGVTEEIARVGEKLGSEMHYKHPFLDDLRETLLKIKGE